MSERKLDHFSDGCHLLSTASNIVVADIVEFFLVFSIDGLSFSIEHGVGCNDTEFLGFSGDNLELDGLEVAPDDEKVSLFDGAVGVLEVGDQVGFGEVTGNALNGVLEREDVDLGQIGDVSCRFDLHNIAQTDSEVFADGFVHSDFSLLELGIDQGNHKGFFSLLALDEDGVSLEDFELIHFGLAELDGGVLVGIRLFDLNHPKGTMSLLGAFFWSRMAVDTSFFTGSIYLNLKYDQKL